MTQKTFNTVAGTVFLLVATLHALRLFFGWQASIGGWIVPIWVSGAGVVVAGFLAYTAFGRKRN